MLQLEIPIEAIQEQLLVVWVIGEITLKLLNQRALSILMAATTTSEANTHTHTHSHT